MYFECVEPRIEEITYDEDGDVEDYEVIEDAYYFIEEIKTVKFKNGYDSIRFWFKYDEKNDKNSADVYYKIDGVEYKKDEKASRPFTI